MALVHYLTRSTKLCLWILALAIACSISAGASTVRMVCTPTNDLCRLLLGMSAVPADRYDNLSAALLAAKTGDGLMVMADAMRDSTKSPQNDTMVNITEAEWSKIDAMALKTYIEFPAAVPHNGSTALQTLQTVWERIVVTKNISSSLPAMALLHPHKHIDFVVLPQAWLRQSDLVLATVAGYDRATFGIPATAHPLLVQASPLLMIAATQLSHARTRRFAPSKRWMAVLSSIVGWLLLSETVASIFDVLVSG